MSRTPGPPSRTSDRTDRAVLSPGASATIRRASPEEVELARLREEVAGLRLAMQSRASIEQAKGALMAVYAESAEGAFARLVQVSQHRNVKLRALAEVVVRLASAGALSATVPLPDLVAGELQDG